MLTEHLAESLDKEGVSLIEFRELCLRLLNYGVLCRAENQTEQALYDRYLRIEDIVVEYLRIIGIRILHERQFSYLRIYPPGTDIPGMDDDSEAAAAFGGGLRARLRQDEVALLLVLRLQYDKALREGQLDDDGFVSESIESISIAMKNLLGRSLPEKIVERKRVFARLRQLRLVEFRQDDNMDSAESWVKIHPMIVTFVTDESLSTLESAMTDESDGASEDATLENGTSEGGTSENGIDMNEAVNVS